MIPTLDPFAQEFDSIDVDPARAPPREAIESAMASVAPSETAADEPGFYLLNDANGRFAVDRDLGVVTLADDSILQAERNSVHPVRLRVVEASGSAYELDLQLRISGRVPQMVGAEEFAAIAGLTDETILVAPRVPVLVIEEEIEPQPLHTEALAAPIAWTRFAAAQGHASRTSRLQPRRSFIAPELPTTDEQISVAFEGLPPPFPSHLPWSF